MTDEEEYYEERAAIMQFEGGLSRKEAERIAHTEMLDKYYSDDDFWKNE